MDNTKYAAVKPTRLSASITSSATSITVAEVKDRAGNTLTMTDFGNTGYGVFEPGTDREEHFTFTGISSTTISGVTRGLGMVSPYTNVAANQKAHAAGTIVILESNTPRFYDELSGKDNDETITGTWTFTSTAKALYDAPPTFSADEELITKKYADDLAIAGAPDMSLTVKGLGEKATDAELAAGTADGGGGTSAPLIATATSFNETAAAAKVPVAESTGKLGEDWIGLTTAGDIVYTDGTDLQRLAIGTSGQVLTVNSGATAPEWAATDSSLKFGGDGSDGALDTSGGVVDIALGSAEFLEKDYSSINIVTNNLTFSGAATKGTFVHLKCSGDATISASIVADFGAAGGAGGAGGASLAADGVDGTAGTDSDEILDVVAHFGAGGEKGASNNGGGANSSTAAAYTTTGVGNLYTKDDNDLYRRILYLVPGAGGAGGGGGAAGADANFGAGGAGGAGGIGGGAILLEVAGDINFTGTIDASGTDGVAGTVGATASGNPGSGGGGGGGGAGGAGGQVVVLYNTATSVAGTIDVTSGAGGAGGDAGLDNNGSSGGGGGGGEGGSAAASISGTGGAGADGSDGNGSATSLTGGTGGASVAESTNGNAGGATSGGSGDDGDGGAGGGGASGGGGEAVIVQNKWFV